MTRTARAAPLTLALVVLAAVLPYLNAFGHAFVRDDEVIIRDNAGLRSLGGLREALLSNYWGEAAADAQWRPLALLSWALNYAAGGLATAGYTAVDLAIHAGVCLALLHLALSLGAPRLVAAAAALLFAVHPVHTEAVTGFVGRADTLATLFVLLTLVWHRRAAAGSVAAGSLASRSLAALFLALALLTKESAVAALALIPALDWLVPAPGPDGRPAGVRARLRRDYALYAAVAVAWLGARYAVLGTLSRDPDTILPAFNPLVPERPTPLGELRGAGPAERLLTPFALVAEAARLLVWPAHLSMDYSFEQLPLAGSLFDGRVLAGLLVVALVLAAVLRGRRRAPALAFAAAFALLAWLPTANLLFPIGTLFAERLLYLPSAGALLALALLLGRLAERSGWRAPVIGLTAVALLALGARTWARNPAWRDSGAVTAAMVADAPASFLSHSARGSHLLVLSQAEPSPPRAAALRAEARRHLETSLAICPESEQTNRAFVGACWDDGDPAATLPAYERLARLDPQDARVHQGWALALIELAKTGDQQGRLAEAHVHLERALALDPREADALYARGLLRALDPERRSEALADLQAVLRLRPDHPERAQIEAEIARLQAPGR